MAIKNWSKTAALNNSAPPNGWPEGMAPSAVNDTARQQMADLRTQFEDLLFLDYGHTPVQQTSKSFLLSLTATDIYTAGRLLRAYDATVGYITIKASSASGANTLVSITGGTVTSSLSAVAIHAHDPATSPFRLEQQINADIASAGTLGLDATTDYGHITGTATVTSVVLAAGRVRTSVFDGAVKFINSSHLITGSGADATTAAGDVVRFRGESGGVVRVERAPTWISGTDILITTASASNSSAVTITGLPSTYDVVEVELVKVLPQTSSAFVINMSVDNGANYEAGSSAYSFAIFGATPAASGTALLSGNSSAAAIRVTAATSTYTVSGYGGINGTIRFYNIGSTSVYKQVRWDLTYFDNTPTLCSVSGSGCGFGTLNNLQASAVNALKFSFGSGNIVSGSFIVRARKSS